MRVRLYEDRASLGQAAAEQAAAAIRRSIVERGKVRIVGASAASQIEFLEALIATPGIDWKRVELFHLDEYIGLPSTHPASFCKFLEDRLISKTGIVETHLLRGEGETAETIARTSAAILNAPIDVSFVGIGENGHLAFNDPPADFAAEEPYIVVDLDETCRRQQVAEGWFEGLESVPKQAISMSIRQVLKAGEIIAIVPGPRKAEAVRRCLEGPIGPLAPASILRTHADATVYLDKDSAALLSPETLGVTLRPASGFPGQLGKPDRRNALPLRTIGFAARLILCCVLGWALPGARAQFASHAEPNGPVLFSQDCAPCHGSDGRGGEHAPNIATRHDVVAMSDAGLRSIVTNGIPSAGMPAFDSLGDKRIDSLIAYVRVLQGITSTGPVALPGDPGAGEAIFFAQGSCSQCHMVDGRGGFMADDLSDYARGRSVSSIESAIVHPANRSGNEGHWVTVETNGGQTFAGLVRAQSNFTLVIQSQDGEFQSIPTDTIRSLTVSKQPYMPQDYAATLSSKQLNDLISYLLQSAGSPRPVRVIPEDEK